MNSPNQGNLAGIPARLSLAPSTNSGKTHHGWIKFRLCHRSGATFFQPDILVGFLGKKFFLPSFFSPPFLLFNIPPEAQRTEGALHQANFSIDVAAPKGSDAARIQISLGSSDFVRSYADGAQLYRCKYSAAETVRLASLIAGNCRALPNGDFAVELFHHTDKDAEISITSSGELWSSHWNLAGTSKVKKVAYTYFTTLQNISNDQDLSKIAMSPNATIFYQTTSNRITERVLPLRVYREEHKNRDSALTFLVKLESIAPTHLRFHPPNREPAYYESVAPEIARVASEPNTTLRFNEDRVIRAPHQKIFDHIIVGDASTLEGIEAPMKEESTDQVALIEKLDGDLDVFDFWQANQNTDLVSFRNYDERELE